MKKVLLFHPRIISKEVNETNFNLVLQDCSRLRDICFEKIGIYDGAKAMAHVQIEKDNPLRFFVFRDGSVIINPKIIEKENKVNSIEGCISFPFKSSKKIKRFNNIKVEFSMFNLVEELDEIPEIITKEFKGEKAFIFQHEIGHFNLNLIY